MNAIFVILKNVQNLELATNAHPDDPGPHILVVAASNEPQIRKETSQQSVLKLQSPSNWQHLDVVSFD